MKKFYIYPAIFEKEDQYYNVSFPDLPGCLTFGEGEKEALLMAEDACAGWLGLDDNENVEQEPTPSPISSITAPENGFVSLVHAAYHQPEDLGYEAIDLDDDSDENDFEIPEGAARALLAFVGIDYPEESEDAAED